MTAIYRTLWNDESGDYVRLYTEVDADVASATAARLNANDDDYVYWADVEEAAHDHL